MTELQTHSPQDLIEGIARGYAAEATPPLTPELSETLRTALRGIGSDLPKGEPLDEAGVGRINEALDAFELDLGAVVGPRLDAVAPDGTLIFRQRSEAGRPLRAFGGQ